MQESNLVNYESIGSSGSAGNIFYCKKPDMRRKERNWAIPVKDGNKRRKEEGNRINEGINIYSFKGTVSLDFRPSVFFGKQYPWVP
jgi:hypothetical protein